MKPSEFFNQNGYLPLKSLIADPENLKCEVPQERGLIKFLKNKIVHEPEDVQVPGSVARYTVPEYKELHYLIKKQVEYVLEMDLYPTYYYDRFYFVGQELKRHTDREACEISVTLQISTNATKPWDIGFLTPAGKEVYYSMKDGDAVIYKGNQIEHWRNPLQSRYNKFQKLYRKIFNLKDDTYHHQIFFHYVNANGSNLHYAYDNIVV